MIVPKLTPIPIVSGLALQFDPGSDWAAIVGVFAVVAVAVVVAMEKLGLLRKIGGNDTKGSNAELAKALDALGSKVQQLEATINNQVQIMGTFTAEIREATRQAAATHQWIQLQKQLEDELRKRGGA